MSLIILYSVLGTLYVIGFVMISVVFLTGQATQETWKGLDRTMTFLLYVFSFSLIWPIVLMLSFTYNLHQWTLNK